MIEHFQTESRRHLLSLELVPIYHPVWTKGGWKVFLDTPEEVWARIRYVDSNPIKERLSKQDWPFVVAYDNWPFHKKNRS
jgi:hypothetical protein